MAANILVFGAEGLLGHWLCRKYPDKVIGLPRSECDITDHWQIERALETYMPSAVINAAGIVRKRASDAHLYRVNSFAPHKLADLCEQHFIRMIQVSTDCVFDGSIGKRKEHDPLQLSDSYSSSKAAGEIYNEPHLTVRTSFVGWPDPKGNGLLSWFFSQTEPVMGFTNVLWNGLTASILADYLVTLAQGKQTGVMHLFGETISKFELLSLVNTVYELDNVIVPVDLPVKDMTLGTERDDQPKIPLHTFREMLGEMRYWENIDYGN
jgi:dTDP-4-dehydrorhamnose reductase